jgi:hypothetical protein
VVSAVIGIEMVAEEIADEAVTWKLEYVNDPTKGRPFFEATVHGYVACDTRAAYALREALEKYQAGL